MAAFHPVVKTATVTSEVVTDDHIAFAESLADISGKICRSYFGRKIEIIDKPDDSPVTKADLEVEKAIRAAIKEKFPGHSIFGEEYGLTIGEGEDRRYMWVLDPIDGTLSFITGKPLFATLIALLHDGVPVVGVIDQPILRDRWVGAIDHETLHNGIPVTTRKCTDVSSAYMYSVSPDMFYHHRQGAFDRLSPKVKSHIWGGDSYVYGLLANGMVDMIFDANMKVFDYMAFVPIIQGAGGVITDWSGNNLVWDGVKLNGAEIWAEESLACATPQLHEKAIELIDWKGSSR